MYANKVRRAVHFVIPEGHIQPMSYVLKNSLSITASAKQILALLEGNNNNKRQFCVPRWTYLDRQ